MRILPGHIALGEPKYGTFNNAIAIKAGTVQRFQDAGNLMMNRV